MREMILNHASLVRATRFEIDAWLKDVAAGITALVTSGAVQKVLRTDRPMYEIPCPEGRTLWEAWEQLRSEVRERPEEAWLLGDLLNKCSFLDDLSDVDPVRCEAKARPPNRIEFRADGRYNRDAGRPLVYCAINSGIAVSFPSEGAWSGDRVTVVFDQLVRGADAVERVRKDVDNLARFEDASVLGDRCQKSPELPRSCAETWQRRQELFPNLLFGKGVEANLMEQAGLLSTIVRRLKWLDDRAREWKSGGDSPRRWPGVNDESDSVKNNPKWREARMFPSRTGERLPFLWHTHIGDLRVHLRFDESTREIEIGYVGNKLPTALFPK